MSARTGLRLCLLIGASLTQFQASAQPVALKDFALGMTMSSYKALHPDPFAWEIINKCGQGKCKSEKVKRVYDACEYDKVISLCRYKTDMAGINGVNIHTLFFDNKAIGVIAVFTADDNSLSKAEAAAIQKFGQPSFSSLFENANAYGHSWDKPGAKIILSPRHCQKTFWLDSARHTMEAIHTYALDGLCLDSVMYGNDVASLTAVDTQGAEAAYAQVRKADQVKIQQDRSDL